MMRTYKLAELASILTLPKFRNKAPENVREGNIKVITISDLSSWPPDLKTLTRTFVSTSETIEMLIGGDILIAGRGNAHRARLFDYEERMLTAGHIHVIRLRSEELSPSFLAWYLNRPSVQDHLDRRMVRSTIPSLNKAVLTELEIEVPTVEVQTQIAALQALHTRRQIAQTKLIALQEEEIGLACESLHRGRT